jgi:putative endopeptidase
MKSKLFWLAGTALLAGCATTSEEPAPAPVVAAEVAPPPAAPAPKPQIGDFGFDETGMDKSVLPGNSFYTFANGAWDARTEIPADKSNYGMFTMLDDLSRERTKTLIEESAKDPNSRIGAVYASFMDEAAVEAKGLTPLEPWLAQVRGVKSKAQLPAIYAEARRVGVGTPFGGFVAQDDKAPDQYILNFFQAGLGMPDRDYYLKADPKLAETRAKYLEHLTRMLTLAGEKNAAARAKAIVNLETDIAKVSWSRIDSRDATKTYNKMTIAELAKRAPGFDFPTLIKSSGAQGVESLVVAQPSAVTGIAKIISRAPLAVLRDQLLVRSLDGYAGFLPKAFDDENFAFYGTVLNGTPQQEARWKRGVNFTVGVLQDDVSKLYVDRFFPPETKAAADTLVKNVIAAMGRRIDKLEWMSPETKVKAHAKLAAFTPKIGYPSQWRDMSALFIDRNDLLGNAMRSNQFDYAYNVNKLGKPIYRWEWGMTPMTINAYANFGMVEIVFPAAILQPPFFDPHADPALNYGGIGSVIGHELSHHFDDQGAKYDLKGNLSDWWTPEDVAAFQRLSQELVKQYDAYEVFPGAHVKGEFTLGENIGDLAGILASYDAYKTTLNGKEAPVIDGFTGDQRFYLGWAQIWRRKYREANLLQRLLTDPHSPSEQRAAVVRNLDPWYAAYRVAPDDTLYLAPERRVRIW